VAPATQQARSPRVLDIRKGDQVVVLSGREAGKRGTVEHVIRNRQSYKKSVAKHGAEWRRTSPLADAAVVVEGLNIAKRHTKPRPKQGRTERQPRIQQGGIMEIPQPIPVSKVMLVCPHCSHPTRIRHGLAGDGRSVRLCSNCGETLTHEVAKKK
jgi:large subunit ribosomal protein L24